MTNWEYDGYVKVKRGAGRNARYIEFHDYKCPVCGYVMRLVENVKPPANCPNCILPPIKKKAR